MFSEYVIEVLRRGGPIVAEATDQLVMSVKKCWEPALDEDAMLLRKADGHNARVRLTNAERSTLGVRLKGIVRINYVDPPVITECDVPQPVVDHAVSHLQSIFQNALLRIGYWEQILFLGEELERALRDNEATGATYIDPELEEKIQSYKERLRYLQYRCETATRFKPAA